MSQELEFAATALAEPESLAGRLIEGCGPVALPRLSGAPGVDPHPVTLSLDSFGTTSPAVAGRLERVLKGEGLVVTTGQQPVLFLGPLYVMYKALTAIELARALEERFDVPVVPVFWIASDDHDWEEIGQTTLLDREGNLETLKLEPAPGFERRGAGAAPLGSTVGSILERLTELVPKSEFTQYYLELFQHAYAPEKSVGEAFAESLVGILEGSDFAWLDAADSGVKEASRPLFERIFDEPGGVLDAMRAGEDSIEAAGFEVPISRVEGGLPLFYDDGKRRSRILRTGTGFAAGRGGRALSRDEWKARLTSEASRFSPNVSSRPLLESFLMPVAATVLGPGETAYWSQLPPLFDHFGVSFPAVVPRASWIVIEPRVRRVLDQLSLDVSDFSDGGHSAIARLTDASRPRAVHESLDGLRSAIGPLLADVETSISEALPGLKGAVGRARKAMFDAVTTLSRQVDGAVRQRQENTISKVRRAAAQLFPGRRPQERVLSPLHFFARYGSGLTEAARRHTAEWLSIFLAAATDDS